VSAAAASIRASPGTVLRRALLAWGLGDLALGRRAAGFAWLGAEILAAALIAYLVLGLADTTWYLVPFLAGILFLVAWAAQAVLAFRRAQRSQGAIGPTPPRSPAAAVAWLSVPLLLWGTGFWLVAGNSASPAAVVDRFETSWPDLAGGGTLDAGLSVSSAVVVTARNAIRTLQQLCAEQVLSSDCATTPRNLLRDVRIALSEKEDGQATAVAEVVSFERRPSRFLWVFAGTELVPVPRQTVLTLDLRAIAAPLPGGSEVGVRRWQIVNATTP
jgi:hypothetical protein